MKKFYTVMIYVVAIVIVAVTGMLIRQLLLNLSLGTANDAVLLTAVVLLFVLFSKQMMKGKRIPVGMFLTTLIIGLSYGEKIQISSDSLFKLMAAIVVALAAMAMMFLLQKAK